MRSSRVSSHDAILAARDATALGRSSLVACRLRGSHVTKLYNNASGIRIRAVVPQLRPNEMIRAFNITRDRTSTRTYVCTYVAYLPEQMMHLPFRLIYGRTFKQFRLHFCRSRNPIAAEPVPTPHPLFPSHTFFLTFSKFGIRHCVWIFGNDNFRFSIFLLFNFISTSDALEKRFWDDDTQARVNPLCIGHNDSPSRERGARTCVPCGSGCNFPSVCVYVKLFLGFARERNRNRGGEVWRANGHARRKTVSRGRRNPPPLKVWLFGRRLRAPRLNSSTIGTFVHSIVTRTCQFLPRSLLEG